MKNPKRIPALLVALICLLVGGGEVWAQAAKPILSLPATITKPGHYLVKKNLRLTKMAKAAITIEADDVVLDLGGNVISSGLAAGTDVAGISSAGHGGITVKNGTVRGFNYGIDVNALQAAVGDVSVEGVRADGCELVGISVKAVTLAVRRCTIVNTGNGGIYSPTGLYVDGAFGSVIDNEVLGTVGVMGSFPTGIQCSTQACVMENNRVLNQPSAHGATGIFAGFSSNYLVENNRVAGFTNGIKFTNTGNPKYRNNFTTDCTTPFTSGTSAGNNQ